MRHHHTHARRVGPTGMRVGALLVLLCAALWRGPGAAAAAAAAGDNCYTLTGATTCAFTYTGAPQTWTVPAGITQVTVDAFGAQGGNGPTNFAEGGLGGRATATLAVAPGATLTIVVGGRGRTPWDGEGAGGGYNGGGDGGAHAGSLAAYAGGGGGGASDVRLGGGGLAQRAIVAGGGGGAAALDSGGQIVPSVFTDGGAGGGLVGGGGAWGGGAGGNQDGATGSGLRGQGGTGADNPGSVPGGFCCEPAGGGGGGGGYYGGAGGAAGLGGGGGSGFGPAGVAFATGVNLGDGRVLVRYTPAAPDAPVACEVTTTTDRIQIADFVFVTAPGSLREKLEDSACGVITFRPDLTGIIWLWDHPNPVTYIPSLAMPSCVALALNTWECGEADLPTVTRAVRVIGPGARNLGIVRRVPFPLLRLGGETAFTVGANGHLTLSGVTVSGAERAIALTDSTARLTLTDSHIGRWTPPRRRFIPEIIAIDPNGIGPGCNCRNLGKLDALYYQNTYGIVFAGGGTATVANSTISENLPDEGSDSDLAAGLYFAGGGTATVSNSTLAGNLRGLELIRGGTATVANSTLAGRYPYGTGFRGLTGVGIFLSAGSAVTVTNSTIRGNFLGPNSSNANGFGLQFADGGTATVANSTIADNSVGLYFAAGGAATVTNSTFAGNTFLNLAVVTGAATLTNTLLARGSADANCLLFAADGLADAGHNLADDDSCFADNGGPGSSSHVRTTAQLALDPVGLRDNGGPTPTIALLPGSAARDTGDPAACAATGPGAVNNIDQRGFTRPIGPVCDIGAFEFDPRARTALSAVAGGGTYGGPLALTATLRTSPGGVPVGPGLLVAFAVDGAPVCGGGGQPACPATDAGGVASLAVPLALGAGNYLVAASFAGTDDYYPSDGGGTLAIARAPSTTAVTAPDAAYTGNPYAGASAAATGAGGLNQPVTPLSYSGRGGTAYGPSATPPTNAGTYTASASYAGDADHTGSQGSADFAVTKAAQALTFPPDPLPDRTILDAPFAVTPTASSGLPVTVAAGPPGVCTVSGTTVTIVGLGTCTVTAGQAGNANYLAAPDVARPFRVTRAVPTLANVRGTATYGDATAALTATLTFGGAPLAGKTLTFTLDGAAAGTAVTNAQGVATLPGVPLPPGTNAGSYANRACASFAGDATYEPTGPTCGPLTVARRILWVKPTDRTVVLKQPNPPGTPPAGCVQQQTPTAACWLQLANGGAFVNGDDWADLNLAQLRFAYSRTGSGPATEQVGATYRITALGALSTNYDLRYQPGMLTVVAP